jgi:hypothetical protein
LTKTKIVELVVTFGILAMLSYIKLMWWTDPITLGTGCLLGSLLVVIGNRLTSKALVPPVPAIPPREQKKSLKGEVRLLK